MAHLLRLSFCQAAPAMQRGRDSHNAEITEMTGADQENQGSWIALAGNGGVLQQSGSAGPGPGIPDSTPVESPPQNPDERPAEPPEEHPDSPPRESPDQPGRELPDETPREIQPNRAP